MDFAKFCDDAEIIDKNCNVGMVDRAFIAVNYEEENLDDNPNRELCRYEFMEILIRIADFKYRQNKVEKEKAKTFAEAYQRVLDELFAKYKLPDWQEFRTDLLWAMDTNSVFE